MASQHTTLLFHTSKEGQSWPQPWVQNCISQNLSIRCTYSNSGMKTGSWKSTSLEWVRMEQTFDTVGQKMLFWKELWQHPIVLTECTNIFANRILCALLLCLKTVMTALHHITEEVYSAPVSWVLWAIYLFKRLSAERYSCKLNANKDILEWNIKFWLNRCSLNNITSC